ncbi:Aminomethyltransferase folate-binding domain-containing protein [Xylariomycetidae sp. FL0641]|nr:Aminomethyltransferase folate-binding domain-containing protein [Xylariomycetidae sp. FL0641]
MGLLSSSSSLLLAPTTAARVPFVCASCRLHQSRLSGSGPASRNPRNGGVRSYSSAPPPPPAAGYARLRSRRLVSLAGADAARFLQGIVTASVPGAGPPARGGGGGQHATTNNPSNNNNNNNTTGFYSGLLNATGRVLYDVFVYRDTLGLAKDQDPDHAFLLEVDADRLPALVAHLRRYKLRSQVAVRALDEDEVATWAVWGTSPASSNNKNIVLPDTRAPGLGARVLCPGGEHPAGVEADDAPESAYTLRRYLYGIPEGAAEIPPAAALPLEANLDLMGAVDFRKGCYVGQELTIRTKHRGVVRKRVLPCALYPDDGSSPAPDALAYDAGAGSADRVPHGAGIGRARRKGRSAGTWLAGRGNIGLALVRLQVMTDLELPGETAAAPFDPADEFVVKLGEGTGEGGQETAAEDAGQQLKIKAFVPDWLRAKLAEANAGSH